MGRAVNQTDEHLALSISTAHWNNGSQQYLTLLNIYDLLFCLTHITFELA